MMDRCLADLHNHTRDGFPFTEAFARISVGFAGSQLGLGALHPRAILSTYQVADPLLSCWLTGPDGWRAVRRRELRSKPWSVRESGSLGAVSVAAHHVFLGPDSLQASFTLTNDGATEVAVEPAWVGIAHPDGASYMLPYFPGATRSRRELRACATAQAVEARLTVGSSDSVLPEVRWRVTAFTDGVTAETLEHPPWAEQPVPGSRRWLVLRSPTTVLAPGGSATWIFRVDAATAAAGVEPQLPEAVAMDTFAAEDAARARVLAALGTTPEDDLALRARVNLLRNGVLGAGALGGLRACLCTADSSDFSCVFFWDSLFSSVAIAGWNRGYAEDAVRAVFVDQDARDGSSGERHWDRGCGRRLITQSPQMPIAAWAVWEQVRDREDRSFAREMWPALTANHRFWEEYSDTDRDGLAEIRWSGQMSDNSPLWDGLGMGENSTGCGWLPPIASVGLNCFLYRDAGHLAQLADVLDKPDEARCWRERAQRIAAALHEHCFVAADGVFWDRDHHARMHRKVRTFWMFWPLWSGIPMADGVREGLLARLADPRQFLGAVPFPSVAYDEPAFDAAGYWRGRAWPHISTWLCETLWRHGRRDEADIAARRILAWYSSQEGLRENLCTDPGHPRPGGFADYNWGNAAVDLLSSGRWRNLAPG